VSALDTLREPSEEQCPGFLQYLDIYDFLVAFELNFATFGLDSKFCPELKAYSNLLRFTKQSIGRNYCAFGELKAISPREQFLRFRFDNLVDRPAPRFYSTAELSILKC